MNNQRNSVIVTLIVSSALLCSSASADLTVLDFEGLASLEIVDNQFAGLGVDFNSTARNRVKGVDIGFAAHSGTNFIANNIVSAIRADSVGQPWQKVSTYIASFSDTTIFRAFDSSDNELGSIVIGLTAAWTGPHVFDAAVLGSPIAYVTLTDDGSDVGFDDFGFEPIPAPGAAVLGAMGLGLVGWAKRRFC